MTEIEPKFLNELMAHRKRWNISYNQTEAYSHFRARLNFYQVLKRWQEESLARYEEVNQFYDYLAGEYPTQELPLSVTLANSSNLTELIHRLQLVFLTLENFGAHEEIESIYLDVQKALRFTPEIELEVVKVENRVTLYPAGARLLDNGVVNQTLSWLEPHHNVLRAFEKALTMYSEGDASRYRNILDELRFALEQLLKNVLGNSKSLENQKTPLLTWLNERGAHQQTINMFQTLLVQYSKYQNDAVKHGEQYAENDIEFIIYLTGTFMRLLLRLEQKT